jgi:hypothetical protein
MVPDCNCGYRAHYYKKAKPDNYTRNPELVVPQWHRGVSLGTGKYLLLVCVVDADYEHVEIT